MSIESEILRIQHNVASAYAKVAEKGGEVPLQPTSANLAAAIETIAGGGSSGGVPKGTIVIWSGTASNIPDGWALCDGQAGRPDLRDKFVLGAGTEHAVGDTGGEETHTLTVEEMPEHKHTITSNSNGKSGSSRPGLTDGGNKSISNYMNYEGGSQPHNNMPPYYALCYIIKTTEDSGGGGNPIGTVISFLGTSAPAGYLVCDGAQYSVSQYPDLAAFFQTQFGAKNYFGGDEASTFAVPDMRNLFLRGYHGESEEQLSGGIGERQEATLIPRITGTNGIALFSGGTENVEPKREDSIEGSALSPKSTSLSGTGPNTYSPYYTSRPVNTAVLYCIKAI